MDLFKGLIVARPNKQVVQIVSLPVALGITASVATKTAELTTSLTIYYQFSSQFIQDLKWVAQNTLTIQGQINSLAS